VVNITVVLYIDDIVMVFAYVLVSGVVVFVSRDEMR